MGAPPRAQEASRRQRQYLRREKAVALSQGYRLIKRYIHILIAVLVVLIGFNVSTEIALAPTVHAQYDAPVSIVTAPEASTTKAIPDPTASNCWLYIRSLIPSFPNTAELKTNTTPHVGAVVLMDYPHYALITKMDDLGFWVKDSNWGGPGYRTHYFLWTNPHITGYWAP